jgi:hypothetical protein
MGQTRLATGSANRWLKVAGASLLVCLLVPVAILVARWPFTQERVLEGLGNATSSEVRAERFRSHVFPRPGCTLEGLTVARGQTRLASADKLIVRSSWWTLLTLQRRVAHMQAVALKVTVPKQIPPRVSKAAGSKETTIGTLTLDGSVLELARGGEPLRFVFEQLRLKEVARASRIQVWAHMKNPHPPGDLLASGSIGPFERGHRELTPLSGNFELKDARMDRYGKLTGIARAIGKFEGKLERIAVDGSASISGFRTNPDHQPVDLALAYSTLVNASSGDVLVRSLAIDFLRTHAAATGRLANGVLDLEVKTERARIEDVLRVFTKAAPPALSGPMWFACRVGVPSGEGPFLRRVALDGTFRIRQARWNKPRTQAKVNELSARARRDKEEAEQPGGAGHVVSELGGSASLRSGIATLTGVTFRVPGAAGTGAGTYNVISKRVDLRGHVTMIADVSEATSGIKSVLLRPFNALFRRNRKDRGATLGVSIRGTVPRPRFQIGP